MILIMMNMVFLATVTVLDCILPDKIKVVSESFHQRIVMADCLAGEYNPIIIFFVHKPCEIPPIWAV